MQENQNVNNLNQLDQKIKTIKQQMIQKNHPLQSQGFLHKLANIFKSKPKTLPLFDVKLVVKLANKKFKKLNLKINKGKNKHKYGEDIREKYFKSICVMEALSDVCIMNNWHTKESWKENNVPVEKQFNQLLKDTNEYGTVIVYYSKQFFDERTRQNLGR